MKRALAALLVSASLLVVPHPVAAQGDDGWIRTYDGFDNNPHYPFDWGVANSPLLRKAAPSYSDDDGVWQPPVRANPRAISNLIMAQDAFIANTAGATNMIWQWGQFLDHDLDLTPEAHPGESFPIVVPGPEDPYYDPADPFNGTDIPLLRALYWWGTPGEGPRQQINVLTAFIDASNVYGSSYERSVALRTFEGGQLKTSNGYCSGEDDNQRDDDSNGEGNDENGYAYLPCNFEGWPNAGGDGPELFLAGDVRANEQIALTAMHTLFLREHNRLCKEIAKAHPRWDDEEIFQRARKIVGAQMQVITYREFLPALLGEDAIPPYGGYDEEINPGIANEFSTAAYRFGHSMLPPELVWLNKRGRQTALYPLGAVFFNPALLRDEGGLSPLLRGLALTPAQQVDPKLDDAVRNFLFSPPGLLGSDLACLNIQRGRDHGLGDYNSVREAYGLPPAEDFEEISPTYADTLAELYDEDLSNIDPWVAGLAEEHVAGALVGETFYAIIRDQFIRLRDGDRFWYENDPFFLRHAKLKRQIENTSLADIIRRNTQAGHELPDNVFFLQNGAR